METYKDSIQESTGEIVVYQPDEITRLEVRVNEETVWLTQGQMAELFQTSSQNITIHIRNIYDEGELQKNPTCKEYLQVQQEGSRIVRRRQKTYNLDVIISVGYRVKSIRGTQFRQWANGVLKAYLIKGYSINAQLLQISLDINKRLESHAITLADHESVLKEHSKKIDFFIQSSLPPKQGIFFDGQIYDAYTFVADLVRKAARRIVLIDNYIDDTVLTMLSKRAAEVEAVIYTAKISKQLQLDIDKHNAQYPQVEVRTFSKAHDRFLIIDDAVYLVGASIKDLGKKWFGFTLMENTDAEELLEKM
ncbi:MAG: DNA-binding protein [Bacteroidales bacterium]|nr:DNA-binding protein [Bacteroidales bacterium]